MNVFVHEKRCYDASNVIIEDKESKNVFYGYTSVGFTKYDNNSYTQDDKAFLYSIRNINKKYSEKIYPLIKGQECYALGIHQDGFVVLVQEIVLIYGFMADVIKEVLVQLNVVMICHIDV